MNSSCLLVLSLAVFGASAAPLTVIGCNSGCGAQLGGCSAALPGTTTIAQTPVIENPTSFIPSILPSTSVSQSYHCMKTIVRPQLRNEVISVPQVDRLVRYVPSPVVDVVSVNSGPVGTQVDIPTYGVSQGIVAGNVIGSGIVNSGIVNSGIVGSGIVNAGIVGSGIVNAGIVGSGIVNAGIVGSGCVDSGIVATPVVSTPVIGSGIVGSGLVNSCGCGSSIVV